jgi:hypothetical protein
MTGHKDAYVGEFDIPVHDPSYLPVVWLGIVVEKERLERTARAIA